MTENNKKSTQEQIGPHHCEDPSCNHNPGQTNEEGLREKYLQFQMLQQQIEEYSKHAEMMNQQNIELEISVNALKELEKTETNTEILSPIANGIFIKSNLSNNQKVIINVGSGITVEKTITEAIILLEEQHHELIYRIQELDEILTSLSEQGMRIYQDLENQS